MDEARGLAARVNSIVELCSTLAALCARYQNAGGRHDIYALWERIGFLHRDISQAQYLLDDQREQDGPPSQGFSWALDECASLLLDLKRNLQAREASQAEWPYSDWDMGNLNVKLAMCENTIVPCLKADQPALDLSKGIENLSLHQNTNTSKLHVPFVRDPDFVNRPDVMIWLHDQYRRTRRMALVGRGGLGKSKTALEFAHQTHTTFPQTNVFWVAASSGPRFEETYRAIAEKIKLPNRQGIGADVLMLVHDWLLKEESGPWLMVLDNADEMDLLYPEVSGELESPRESSRVTETKHRTLQSFLPNCGHGKILITSRSIDVARRLTARDGTISQVLPMNHDEATLLLEKKFKQDLDTTLATELVEALDYNPMAITQATAYINCHTPPISPAEYLNIFRQSQNDDQSLINRDGGYLRQDETVSSSVIATWQIAFDEIRRARPGAANLLFLMSFFNPQGIPQYVLRSFEPNLENDIDIDRQSPDFERDFGLLCDYSLVLTTGERHMCELHPIVKFCTQVWISVVDDFDRWRTIFLQTITVHFPNSTFNTWPLCRILLPHMEWILEEEPQNRDLRIWAMLLGSCSSYMAITRNFQAAERLSKKVVDKLAEDSELGEHAITLKCMSILADAYANNAHPREAEEVGARDLEIRMRRFGEEHHMTLTALEDKGLRLCNQQRWREAERVELQVLKGKIRIFGEEHPDTLRTMTAIVTIYNRQGRMKEAEEVGIQVVEMHKRVHEEDHIMTLTAMHNLATVYISQFRWEEANQLLQHVVRVKKRLFGDEHRDTLASMGSLGFSYAEQGQSEEAKKLMLHVVTTEKRVLGPDDPNLLASMGVLASIYMDEGNWLESEELCKSVLETKKRVWGRESPQTADALWSLVRLYRKQGRATEAEETAISIVDINKRTLGEEDPTTLASIQMLGITYVAIDHPNEAERTFAQLWLERKRILGEENADTLSTMHNVAATRLALGRTSEGMDLMRECIAIRERVFGPEHEKTLISKRFLVNWENGETRLVASE